MRSDEGFSFSFFFYLVSLGLKKNNNQRCQFSLVAAVFFSRSAERKEKKWRPAALLPSCAFEEKNWEKKQTENKSVNVFYFYLFKEIYDARCRERPVRDVPLFFTVH